ncbi:MAG: ankyrin repeat domain-containing protein [Clostridiales bacterium]|nr:ankyrin repeat domain-containing protein [Clostridiales bacterium]
MRHDSLQHPIPALFPKPSQPRVSKHRHSWVPKGERSLDEQLIQAAWENDLPLVKTLVSKGADINYQDSRMESCYLIATSEGYLDLLSFCLQNGADFSVCDSYGGNGMIRAAERGHGAACALLYAAGDPVDHVNNLPYTALTEAVIFGTGCLRYAETVLLLLAAGADPNFKVQGKSIIQLAQEQGFTALAQILERCNSFPPLEKSQAAAYMQDCYRAGDAGGAALTLRQHRDLAGEDLMAPDVADEAILQHRGLIKRLMVFLRQGKIF